MINIPFSVLPSQLLDKYSDKFFGVAEILEGFFPYLQLYLKQARLYITAKKYLAMCAMSISFNALFIFLISFMGCSIAKVAGKFWISLGLTFFFSLFMFMQQMYYPKLLIAKRIKNLERNTLAAVQSIYIQLKSGVPLMDLIANIAASDFGEVSHEFMRVIKEINAGRHQIEAMEEMTLENPSVIFRRAIWQMINGMKTGADMGDVLKEVMDNLAVEQILQIERYGGQLSPLSMFYMLFAVIMPALAINFLIVIASFISLSSGGVKMIFWGTYAFTFMFQLMFMGIIKSRRPNLLSSD